MLKKGANKTLFSTVVGWSLAAACAVAGAVYIHQMANRDLSVMLCVDGEPLCRVEDRAVVDEALLLLDAKLENGGIHDDAEFNFSYRYVPEDGRKAASAVECMELLYDLSSQNYSRAYMISVQGIEVAACATYAEAEKVVSDFRDYIVEQVMSSQSNADHVELTTEFEIKNVFCRRDRIASAADVYRLMVGENGGYDPDSSEVISDTRVNAGGSQSILFADKNADFGLIKNPSAETGIVDDFSFNMSGLNSAIEYTTVVVEKYSEIIGFMTEFIETDELFKGQTEVLFEGENGICENVYEIYYADGVEISRKLISSTVIAEAKNRIERVGTKEQPSTDPTGSFMWPLEEGKFRITSYYGIQRNGFESAGEFHLGLDIAGPKLGDPIYAADGGVVTYAGERGTYGLLIKIQHENGVETYYSHMSKIDVQVGDRVYKGQKIAEIGRTGVATGVHLHFEVRIDGKTVDPLNYLPKLK